MPGLVAFNRRWGLGSDDFVFPVIVENCFRLSWLIAISVVFHINKDAFDCTSGHLLHIYFVGVITLISISALINIFIIHVSMKGTITNTSPRHRIPLLLYIKVALLVPEVVWLILGTYWAFGRSYNCDIAVVWTVRGAVFFAWFAGFCMFVGFLLVFDPVGTQKMKHRLARSMADVHDEFNDASASSRKMWEARCRLLCFCVAFKQDHRAAFTEIAKLVAEFFQDVDLVPTDIAAGLILVQHQQAKSANQLSAVATNTTTQSATNSAPPTLPNECPNPESWMNIKLMSHYMKYALASYGWPFFMYTNIFTGIFKLASKCRCCSCVGANGKVNFDNSCQCNTAAIKKLTGVHDQDLIYASFENKFKQIPFFVAIDRENHSVVISIRGTLSLEDALVDLSAEGLCVHIEDLHDACVHGAMLDCANYIKNGLESMQLLTKAFEMLPGDGRLVIVGHSLGAGVASILSLLLKPTYPSLICFAYSPPGGLMNKPTSEFVRSFVCSVIVGKDLVPRLGMPTMRDLKMKILKALDECTLPKYRILAGGVMKIACSCFASCMNIDHTGLEEPLIGSGSRTRYNSGSEDEPLYRQDALHAIAMEPPWGEDQVWPMCPPGQILHVQQLYDPGLCCGMPEYYASWAVAEDFKEILISPSMLRDHFPDVVLNVLLQLNERNFVPRPKSSLVNVRS